MDEAPVVKLVNAILLSAIKKSADSIRIASDERTAVVAFSLAPAAPYEVEMRLPERLFAPTLQRLSVMASLPYRGSGQVATGEIHLVISDTRHEYFAIQIEGHGAQGVATIRLLRDRPLIN